MFDHSVKKFFVTETILCPGYNAKDLPFLLYKANYLITWRFPWLILLNPLSSNNVSIRKKIRRLPPKEAR